MNAILLFSAHRPPQPVDDKLPIFPAGAANDEAQDLGPMRGPESRLDVVFIGLNALEQQWALASFPGGRRCALLEA